MNSRVSWSVDGIDPSVRERAEAAARRAGMSLSDWLNSTIGASGPAQLQRVFRSAAGDAEPGEPRRCRHSPAAGFDHHADRPDFAARAAPRRRRVSEAPGPRRADGGPPAQRRASRALDARLSQNFSPTPRRRRPVQVQESKQRRTETGRTGRGPRSIAPRRRSSPASMDFAIAEIAARQNELDGPPHRGQMPPRNGADAAPAAVPPSASPRCTAPAPRPGPDFSSLERHLIQITSQIEALQRPDHVEQSIAAFRSELAEIRQAITEAVPRREIESLENEIRSLSRRIDDTRAARQRRPDTGRHRTRARRNPRSAALADAGRATHRLRRGDPQSRRQARPDPALPNDDPSTVQQLEGAIARAARHRLQRRLQRRAGAARPTTCIRCRPRSTSSPALTATAMPWGRARAAPGRADLDAGNKRERAGRKRQFRNCSKTRCARCPSGLDRIPAGNDNASAFAHLEQRVSYLLGAWKAPATAPPRRPSTSDGSRKACTISLRSLERQHASLVALAETSRNVRQRRSRWTPASSIWSSANCPTSASASRKPTAAPRIRSRRFTARSATWSTACATIEGDLRGARAAPAAAAARRGTVRNAARGAARAATPQALCAARLRMQPGAAAETGIAAIPPRCKRHPSGAF